MKRSILSLAVICAASSTVVAANDKMPTLYGQISGNVTSFSDTDFRGDVADTTPTIEKAILGLKGVYPLAEGVLAAYRLEADFAPLAEGDGSKSIYANSLTTDDDIFVRYAGAALITKYGLFAFGDAMSGVYEEFYAPVDIFEVNTQDSTPTGGTLGSRIWTQTKWSKDGLVYKTPVWNNFYAKYVIASIDNDDGTEDDLQILHGVYKTDNFMFGVNLSVYDKDLHGPSSGTDDRERWVVASHYKFGNWKVAGVYEANKNVGPLPGSGADFDVYALTTTYTQDKFRYALSYQNREEPSSGLLKKDTAVIGQLKYTHDEHVDFWIEAGDYSESDNDNIAVGFNVKY